MLMCTKYYHGHERHCYIFKIQSGCMVIYWLNFKVKRKRWPPKKIFVDSRQERFQLTVLSPILLGVSTQRHGHLEQN